MKTTSNLKHAPGRFRVSAIAAALLWAPGSALADNECTPAGVDPSANGATADSFVCSGGAGAFANGIRYSSNGDLEVEYTGPASSVVGNGGIRLVANGTDDLIYRSNIPLNSFGNPNSLFSQVSLSSASGSIVFASPQTHVFADETLAPIEYGIRAISTGGGDIDITAFSAWSYRFNAAANSVGIEARTDGDITITTLAGTNANVAGRRYGILALGNDVDIVTGGIVQAVGTGADQYGIFAQADNALSIVTSGSVSAGNGGVAIHAEAGAGGIRLTTRNTVSAGSTGTAIRAITSGTFVLNIEGGVITGALDFTGVQGAAGIPLVFSGSGAWQAGGTSFISNAADTITLGGTGVSGIANGAIVNLAGGNDTVTLNSRMNAGAGTLLFGAGNDVMTVNGHLAMAGSTLDFGGDNDRLTMNGTMSSTGLSTITGLETFNHAGALYLGGSSGTATNSAVGDVLRLTGGTYAGIGNARVEMDVFLGSATQSGCDALSGAADCLDLRGASTSGTTQIVINDVELNDAQLGQYNPEGVTLVDVRGDGTSAGEHFLLSPQSERYVVDPVLGGALERPGLFRYTLSYDAETQRHVLVGLPRAEVLDYAVLGSAAHNIWHLTGEAVTNRQAELRDTQEGSVWVRMTSDHGKRDQVTDFRQFDNVYRGDTSYKLDAEALMGGVDLTSGRSEGVNHALGLQMGYVRSRAGVQQGGSAANFTGATLGLYGSLWSERFFVDAAVHTNFLALEYQASGLALKTTTRLESVGAHAEAGLRFTFGQRYFAEPLITVAWVTTTFEEMSLFGGEIQPADADSLRGGLGLRVGAEWTGEGLSGRYFITGRVWDETDGQSGFGISNPGETMVLTDEFSGQITELNVGINLHNKADTVSGYLSAGIKEKDDYDAMNVSAGVRWRW